MCNNFLQQMEIDALEQLISEDVKVHGQMWWFQNLPCGLQNRCRSCCRSRHRSCYWTRHWRSPRSPQCAWTASSFALRKKPYLSMEGVTRVRQLGPCAPLRLPSPSRRRTDLFHGAPRKTHEGGALGWLFFITAEPHSFDGGDGQHRGRRTGTWPWGLLLVEPPPRFTGHTCDGDEEGGSRRRG
jgi:hypothetical protein